MPIFTDHSPVATFRPRLAVLLAGALALVAVVAALAPANASARRPVISYVDAGGNFQLYDSSRKKNLRAPPVPQAASSAPGFRYSTSLDGRFVVYTDAARKLHVLDRFNGKERPLPGIDVFNNPGNLTASNLGLIAFDDNGNGPTRVYDSKARQFVNTGFAQNNKQRQPKLSGDGRYLATTCLDAAQCIRDLGQDSNPYVQNLETREDTRFAGEVDQRDEEHPCLNGNGSLIALDRQSPNGNSPRDVFLYERSSGRQIALPGVMDPAKPETFCSLDHTGNYLGFLFDNAAIRVYERSRSKFLALPLDRPFDTRSTLNAFVEVTKFRASRERLRFSLTTKANVRITIARRTAGGNYKKVGSVSRRDRINGSNTIKWDGKVKSGELGPGRYRATISADGGARGERAKKRKAFFKIR